MQPYTRIENSLLNALCKVSLSGQELRVLLFIIRHTKGFNRDTAELSLTYITNGTEIHERNIRRILEHLKELGYISFSHTKGTKPRKITLTMRENAHPRVRENAHPRVRENAHQEIKKIKKTDQPATADAERLAVIKKALAEEWVPDEL